MLLYTDTPCNYYQKQFTISNLHELFEIMTVRKCFSTFEDAI